MDKVLVSISMPLLNKELEISLLVEQTVTLNLQLLQLYLKEYQKENYKDGQLSRLIDVDNGNILEIDKTLLELGVKNGSRFIAI